MSSPDIVITQTPDVRDGDAQDKTLRNRIVRVIDYVHEIIETIVKPSINSFLEMCDTNPRVAAIVATPALLALLLVASLFIVCSTALVLSSFLKMTYGIIMVVARCLFSLTVKLALLMLITIPLVGLVTGLLVASNAASTFILGLNIPIDELASAQIRRASTSYKEINWVKTVQWTRAFISHTLEGSKQILPILSTLWSLFVTVGSLLYAAFEAANADVSQQLARAWEYESENQVPSETVEEPEDEGVLIPAEEEEIHERLTQRTPFVPDTEDN